MRLTGLSIEQLSIVMSVTDEICRDADLDPNSAVSEEAARLVMRLFWNGHHTADGLRSAVAAEVHEAYAAAQLAAASYEMSPAQLIMLHADRVADAFPEMGMRTLASELDDGNEDRACSQEFSLMIATELRIRAAVGVRKWNEKRAKLSRLSPS